MKTRDQELMERYIYQVVRRLPKEQRNEVALELQELIGDMMEGAESVEEVLMKLGSPEEFAKKYQDQANHLIGPEYYDTYLWFLKIVLICTMIPVLIVSVIDGAIEGSRLFGGDMNQTAGMMAVAGIFHGITNLFIAWITVFGGITLIFAVMECKKVKFDKKKEKEWTINDLGDHFSGKKIWMPNYLSPVPHKKAMISRSDSVVGIVFIVIFGVLLIAAPQLFGAYFQEGTQIRTIPVFNIEQWQIILPVFILSLCIGLADEVVRLVIGHYCRPVMISNIAASVLQLILTFIVLKVFPFWNPDFGREVQMHLGEELGRFADIVEAFTVLWDMELASNILLGICIFATVIEVGTTVYKTLRYGTETEMKL